MPEEKLILLGTHDDYIHSAFFDPATKSLRFGKSTKTEPHPSWLTRHPTIPGVVYANSWGDGVVLALRLDGVSGGFRQIDRRETGGKGLNHMTVLPDGSAIIGAHYGSGTAVPIALIPDRTLSQTPTSDFATLHLPPCPGVPLKHIRQEAPHAHQVVCHGEEVLIPDLGSNTVLRELPPRNGSGWELRGAVWGFADGDGPRHVAIHPKGTHLYTLCELSSTLVCHTLPPLPQNPTYHKNGELMIPIPGEEGSPVCVSRHSILPSADKDNQSKMLASEIIILPAFTSTNKHLLICTNRDSPNPEGDAIATFSVDDDGTVNRTAQGWITGVGRHLRGMAADKEGRYIAVAGRDGGGLVIFERDGREGLTLKEVARIEFDKVVCPLWID